MVAFKKATKEKILFFCCYSKHIINAKRKEFQMVTEFLFLLCKPMHLPGPSYMDVECKTIGPLIKILFYTYLPSPPNYLSEVWAPKPLLWALFLYDYFQNVEN